MADKKLTLAVAGSGKTTKLINQLNLEESFFIVTYTITNSNLIRERIITRYGFLPNNIEVFTYFNFLYSFCVKPFLLFKYNLKGVYLESPPDHTNYLKNQDLKKYISPKGYVYHNRMAKLIQVENLVEDVILRLEKFCDHFYYDETQDLGGHDFNFTLLLSQAKINFLFVGDFYQHTYATSFDRNVNMNLHKNYQNYIKHFKQKNITIDVKSLNNSWRCSPTMCNYISNNLGIQIGSHRTDTTKIEMISDKSHIEEILKNDEIIKLVYSDASKRPFRAKNWGECKGEDDYINTCIILNKNTAKLFNQNSLMKLANRTKNKLYVALSRTRESCYLIDEKLVK